MNEGNEIFAKAVRSDFDRMFPDMRHTDLESAFGGYPVCAVGFVERDGGARFIIKMALSGFDVSDISVRLVDDGPHVEVSNCGSDKTLFSPGVKMAFSKIKSAKFRRSFPLPAGTRSVDCCVVNGMLTFEAVVDTRRAVSASEIEIKKGEL